MATAQLSTRDQDAIVDDTNHDLIHALSVRLDSRWHDGSYAAETKCQGCKKVFDRLRAMDAEAARLLTGELKNHITDNKFPLDLTD
ncbi:MAG: hypothetical protein C0506_10625 [Anaerolinea sp.]|nr:hypothetical protein [Anaerolinea sp.]